MPELIKERCLYCGGDVYYHSRQKLIKCEWCGETIYTVKFENVLVLMQETEEENAQIKQQLAKAEKENETANDRLFSALSALGQIRDDQDVLGQMLHLLTGNQNDALGSLQFLKEISKRLIGSQNDIFARMTVVQDIASQIQKIDMDAQERQTVMSQFMLWSQQTQEEDLQRLQEIAASSDQLLQETQEIHAKVNDLREKSSHLQQTIDAFHTEYTRDKLQELQQLYHQAADFQHDMRFDTAEEYYHNVVTKGGADAEVYWRLIMCHYCLFYEKNDEGRMIPIILNPDLTDPAEMSLRKELDALMTEEERPYYTTKLQEIDRILDKYRLLKGEVQYDIFISVKQDDNGHYTADGDVASDLYDFLKKRGLSVFNSRRTAIPAGHEYEPYIISALLSSKVLIVVGTSPENMLSNWVKNEWSRFQWLQYRDKEKTGKTDRVLFCYLAKGMQAEQIPRALHPDRQAIYDGVKAHDELLAGISFLKTYKSDFRLVADQMKFWLIQGKYDRVLSKYNELTETGLFLSQAQLHLLALCAEKQVIDIQQVVCSEVILDEEAEFKAAIMLCRSDEEKEKLKELLAKNQEWRGKAETAREKEGSGTEKDPEPESAEDCLKYGIQLEAEKNYKEAVKWYREAAKKGLAEAQYHLGLCYETGTGVRKTKKSAVSWYQKAADQGHALAKDKLKDLQSDQNKANEVSLQANDIINKYMTILSTGDPDECLRAGKEADKTDFIDIAEKLYQKSAESGNVEAQYILGLFYKAGRSCLSGPNIVREFEKDPEKAFYWFQKAADQGHGKACYEVAQCHEYGLDEFELKRLQNHPENMGPFKPLLIPRNMPEALKWYIKAAEQDIPEAQFRLAILYQRKDTVPESDDWFEQPEDNTIPEDKTEAFNWYKKAAENNHTISQYNLGLCYEIGYGTKKDPAAAKEWYQKAAKAGFERAKLRADHSPDELFQLGLNASNNGDQKAANDLYLMAAEVGNIKAQLALGHWYEEDAGISKDRQEAVKWYRKAAEQGDVNAQYQCGLLLEKLAEEIYDLYKRIHQEDSLDNKEVDEYIHESGQWYQKAAEAGLSDAQYHYGMFLQTSERNYTEAIKWFEKAAEAGQIDAQYWLGSCYKDAICGVSKNKEKAIFWYQKAADQGHEPSLKALQKLKKRFLFF